MLQMATETPSGNMLKKLVTKARNTKQCKVLASVPKNTRKASQIVVSL